MALVRVGGHQIDTCDRTTSLPPAKCQRNDPQHRLRHVRCDSQTCLRCPTDRKTTLRWFVVSFGLGRCNLHNASGKSHE